MKSSLEKTSRRYTKEQDELILARVKELGYDNPETWKSLAKDFNIKQPHNIKRRCDLLLSRGTGTPQRRTFTKEEDALILRKVEEMGYDNIETWKTLAHELNRDPTPRSILIIKGRYNLISNREIQEKKRFTEHKIKATAEGILNEEVYCSVFRIVSSHFASVPSQISSQAQFLANSNLKLNHTDKLAKKIKKAMNIEHVVVV